MKSIKYIYILAAIIGIMFTGCEKEYKDETRITYYPDFEFIGNEVVYAPIGVNYVDEGVKVTEKGVEIPFEVSSNVNSGAFGSYAVSYTAVNSDGYSKTVERKVIIYDPNVSTEDISGEYNGSVVRNSSEGYQNNTVTLTKLEGVTGLYEISDWIAGFYSVGRGNGDSYNFVGIIEIKNDNQVISLDMSNPWGDPFDDVIGTYDPATKTISYNATWLGRYTFVVNLVKK